jgi:tRNA-specific 2-thiouridylase
LLLARAADLDKDQSYMLAGLDPALLERIWFPLGEQSKEETRAEAALAGLAAARRPESQEACFLGGDDYRAFLERRGVSAAEGPIVDTSGKLLGRHDGHWRFTPGQRRGLGVPAREPLYALRTVPRTNTVVAGPREALACRAVTARGRLHVPIERAEAKLRYRSPALPARVEATASGFKLHLEEPAYGVAPGQAAVLYEDDVVVGAGLIESRSA